MMLDCETQSFILYYDGLYGVGYVVRKSDNAETLLITGTDMADLRRDLNRARTNASNKRRPFRRFHEIADCLLGECFPDVPGRAEP